MKMINFFYIKNFTVEYPYSPEGGPFSEDVDKQWKIKLIYVTEKYFPSMVNRLKITKIDHKIIGPLDCAIDLVSSRVAVVEVELNMKPPNPKTLQIVLQGSIMLQVNAGPIAITKYFLANRDQFPSEKIEKLRTKLKEFANRLHFGLKLNKGLIEQLEDDGTMQHHQAMVGCYNDFCKEVMKYGINCTEFQDERK